MAVSLDGVMVPMKNGGRQAERRQPRRESVGCGTLSFYDEEGERLATIRMARTALVGEEGNVESDAERGEQLSSRETGFEGGEGCRRRR